MIRTRIAPSPTGDDIHIGNLYTALINWAFAKKNNGKFIIRIEDTDRTRFREGAEDKILSSLKAYGLNYDEGPDNKGPFEPYRQSERLHLYKTYAEQLVAEEKAYYCICTPERLSRLREELINKKQIPRYDKLCLQNAQSVKKKIQNGERFVIRLNVTPGRKISFTDLIRGEITFDSSQIDDQVLLKSDGYPTYHLGVVVDDYLMQITHIIRAEEWISSTPKHIILYESLGWPLPIFAHVPILRNPDKSKLSKRKNPVWASWYLNEGYLSEAVLNYLMLMGWSHPEQKEIFNIEEFINKFRLEDINAVGPVFDLTKLTWMNQQYIQNLTKYEFIKKLKEFYPSTPVILNEAKDPKIIRLTPQNDDLLSKLFPLLHERMQTLKDFDNLAGHFFISPNITPRDEKEKKITIDLKEELSKLPDWQKDEILQILRGILQKYEIRMPVLYYLLTGKEKGLPLPESLEILGKEKTLERLTSTESKSHSAIATLLTLTLWTFAALTLS